MGAQWIRLAKLPIIAVTANVLPENQAKYKAAGMTDFCGKPFVLKDILDVIDKHVQTPTDASIAA